MITMEEYDRESFEILTSFKEWAEANFGSITHCFKNLDEDRNGTVSFKELKLACRKLHYKGDVRLLFDCLDITRVRDAGVRSISLSEICFLDNWQIEPSEEELAAMDEPPPPKITSTNVTKEVKAINDRLASPLNLAKLGLSDWQSASIRSIPAGWSPQRSSSVGMLPKLVSPYAQPLWPRGTAKARSLKQAGLTSSGMEAPAPRPPRPASLQLDDGDGGPLGAGSASASPLGGTGGLGFLGDDDEMPPRPKSEGRSASMSYLDNCRSSPLNAAGSTRSLVRPGTSPAGF